MAKASNRRRPGGLNIDELSMNDLAIDNDWLEVSKFVLQLILLVLAAEEVDSIHD